MEPKLLMLVLPPHGALAHRRELVLHMLGRTRAHVRSIRRVSGWVADSAGSAGSSAGLLSAGSAGSAGRLVLLLQMVAGLRARVLLLAALLALRAAPQCRCRSFSHHMQPKP